MIRIEEIPAERIDEFWEIHIRYLLDDGLIDDEEDAHRFWQSLGFTDHGADEYGMPLMERSLRSNR